CADDRHSRILYDGSKEGLQGRVPVVMAAEPREQACGEDLCLRSKRWMEGDGSAMHENVAKLKDLSPVAFDRLVVLPSPYRQAGEMVRDARPLVARAYAAEERVDSHHGQDNAHIVVGRYDGPAEELSAGYEGVLERRSAIGVDGGEFPDV